MAGAVAGLLTLLTGGLVLVSVLAARPLASVIAPGFAGQKHELTVYLIRVVAPGIGFLVLSAWCLGVLNAHRRFFLSYVAPVLWNCAIIAGVALAGVRSWAEVHIAEAAAWGVLIGGAAQFIVQLPAIRSLLPHLKLTFSARLVAVKVVIRRFLPAVVGRGVVTLGTYTDLFLASLLATGAVAVLDRAQVLYLLPISVFAVSVAAAELPELSREQAGWPPRMARAELVKGHAPASQAIARRLAMGSERILLFLLFSFMALAVMGQTIVAALYERVNFTPDDTLLVWLTLAVYSLGMVSTGLSRLLQNACYAAGDVAGPAKISAVRLALSVLVGVVAMLQLDQFVIRDGSLELLGSLPAFTPLDDGLRLAGDQRHLGPVGLALGSMLGAWLELAWLKRRMRRAIRHRISFKRSVLRLVPATALAGALGGYLVYVMHSLPAVLAAVVALAAAGLVYLLAANVAGHPTSRAMFARGIRLLTGAGRPAG